MDREQEAAGTIDASEVASFSRLAGQWWDPRGPMGALHKLNPVRLGYIRDRAAEHFGRDPKRLDSLAGLRVLDIGCGGGVLSEPLARLGAAVVGIDPAQENIAVARQHATQSGLAVITAPPPRRRWSRPAKPSTWFLPWKSSSMSPISACSSRFAPRW